MILGMGSVLRVYMNFEFCEGRKDTDMIDYCRYVYTSWSANLPTSGWNFTRACMKGAGHKTM